MKIRPRHDKLLPHHLQIRVGIHGQQNHHHVQISQQKQQELCEQL
jgi:hypothetical protein